MNESTIAKRYAGGLLEAVVEHGVLPETREALDVLSRVITENEECRAVLVNPIVPREKQKQVVIGLLQQLGAPTIVERFAALLCEKRRMNLLQEIVEALNRLADEAAGIAEVAVTSGHDLTESEKESLRAALSRKLSCEVRLLTETSPDIIGGIIARTGTTVIDGSIKAKLRKMVEGIS